MGTAMACGGTVAQPVGDTEQALLDAVQPFIERYLGSKFSCFLGLECLSQVVAGTCWYFKVQAEPANPAGQDILWVKVFDQPWTNTREVTGLTYKDGDASL